MLKGLLILGSVLFVSVIIRKTGIINTVKNVVFEKVNDVIEMVGDEKKGNESRMESNPSYH